MPYVCGHMLGVPRPESQIDEPPKMNEYFNRGNTQGARRTSHFSASMRFLVLSAGVFLPSAAQAQDESARFQQDPVEQVAVRLLVALAITVVAIPTDVPGLVIPRGGQHAMHAMHAMDAMH